MQSSGTGARRLWGLWLAVALALFAACSALAAMDGSFGYDVLVEDMPVWTLVVILGAAGTVYLALPRLIRASLGENRLPTVYALAWILIAGLAMRMVFLDTQPILEDDYNRYLLDGAVTASGLSPYAHTPLEIFEGTTGNAQLDRIASEAGPILERINYPGLGTVYPPVAEAAFALAHWLKPWSLDAWRLVLLVLDGALCATLLALLHALGRPLVWVALYWWNPVIIKEFHNSAHMDLLVMLPVAATLLLLVRARPLAAAAALSVAIGAKIWPVLLIPPLARNLASSPRLLVACLALGAALSAALLAPVALAGLDSTSGFVAYGQSWQANDALFRAIEWLFVTAAGPSGELLARAAVALALTGFALWICRRPAASPEQVCRRVFLITGALLLLSPTQFPWYYGWIAILLPVFPVRGFLVLAATLPLYYAYFHFAARDLGDWFRYGLVIAIWAPAWMLLLHDALRRPNGLDHENRDRVTADPSHGAWP